MLLGNFFTIDTLEKSDAEIKCTVIINAGHRIFEGHFPGQPVVPGVCMMQMVKEVTEYVAEKKLNMDSAGDMKFLAIIDPRENNIIQVTLNYSLGDDDSINVTALFSSATSIHFKFKGVFKYAPIV